MWSGPCVSDCRPSPYDRYDVSASLLKNEIQRKNYAKGTNLATDYLAQLNCEADEDSESFREVCLDLLKLKVMHREAKKARANGDYQA
jgi:hypothetical protein